MKNMRRFFFYPALLIALPIVNALAQPVNPGVRQQGAIVVNQPTAWAANRAVKSVALTTLIDQMNAACTTNGNIMQRIAGVWTCVTPGSGGTVTSVGLALPAEFTVTGSPVTTLGTLTGAWANQTANFAFAGPASGVPAVPTFRALVGADLPNPAAATKGGVQSFAAVANQFLTSISTAGVVAAAQPAFTNISGTVAATQLPTPTVSTLGGVMSLTCAANQWINIIATTGTPACAQPAFTNISGTLATAQMPAFGSGDVSFAAGGGAGTIANAAVTNAKLANMANSTVKGRTTAATGVPEDMTAAQTAAIIGAVGGAIRVKVGSFTRDSSLASGTQGVTGVGFVPLACAFFMSAASGNASSHGLSTSGGVNTDMVTDLSSANANSTESNAVTFIAASSGLTYRGVVSSFDADGFTITWTRGGAPTAILTISYFCIR